MNLPLFIARRLGLRHSVSGRRSPGVPVAVAGVAIAILVMSLTVSVVLGFKNSIRHKVIGFESEIVVSPMYDGRPAHTFHFNDTLAGIFARTLGPDADVSPRVSATVLLKTDDSYLGIELRGLSNGTQPQKFVKENITDGVMPDYRDSLQSDRIIISASTAKILSISPGDRIYLYAVDGEGVRTRRVEISALYDTSFGERDSQLAFCSTDFVNKLVGVNNDEVFEIEVNGVGYDRMSASAEALQEALADAYYTGELKEYFRVADATVTGAVYFNWLELLDTNVIVIILLMAVVACFTIVSCLFILILERVKMIGILKALGATDFQVSRVFVYMSIRVVITGLVTGNFVSLLILFLQDRFRLIPLDPASYYLDAVPVEFSLQAFVLLNAGALAVAWVVLILPSMIVSRVSPSVTMRYE